MFVCVFEEMHEEEKAKRYSISMCERAIQPGGRTEPFLRGDAESKRLRNSLFCATLLPRPLALLLRNARPTRPAASLACSRIWDERAAGP